MTDAVPFRTPRLSCRPPDAASAAIYRALFDAQGPEKLSAARAEWERRAVAPWTLSHAGNDVGVGGFQIGFGRGGLELSFHLLPELWGDGLASEFVIHALDYATGVLRETHVFAVVGPEHQAAQRVLEKTGFRPDPALPANAPTQVMCWSTKPPRREGRQR
jgi:RimJ/RimL family protein N-acetyltransferase